VSIFFLVVVYLYVVNVTYREFIEVHYTYVLIAFLIFADFSEVPAKKCLFVRKSPLAPYPASIAAPISPTPGTHSRRPDQAESAKKSRPRDRGQLPDTII
jgi:hypothetical protein